MTHNTYFARQPILTVDNDLFGYEILFRDSDRNVFPDITSEEATQRLINESLLGQSFEALSHGSRCFVNFPRGCLLQELPAMLPRHKLVVEVLEDVEPDDELLQALCSLHEKGFTIALDDYRHDERWLKIIDKVGIVKFDLEAQSWEELKGYIDQMRGNDLQFLAERVETREQFERAKLMGFRLFQGYFFSKPELIQQRAMNTSELTVMRLLQAVNKPDIDFEQIQALFSSDLSLSYKLFRIVNAQVAHRGGKIDSLRQAAIYLGDAHLRRFVSLVATQSLNSQAPLELYRMGMVRAYFCEYLANEIPNGYGEGDAFLAGLFSLLDVILGRPMSQVVGDLPISPETKVALVEGAGDLGVVLALVKDYENANWQMVDGALARLGVTTEAGSTGYQMAVSKADQVMAWFDQDAAELKSEGRLTSRAPHSR